MKTAVHFGAGNIGRGFIGLCLAKSDYKVIFVDVNKEIISQLNSRNGYMVDFVGENPSSEVVSGVSGIDIADTEKLAGHIQHADLITTAIGPNILPAIAPVIAKCLEIRVKTNATALNIIACENMVGGSTHLRKLVFENLSAEIRPLVEESVGFPDATVDRIVPVQHNDDPLHVKTEPYSEWDVNKSQFKGGVPEITGLTWVDNLTPYIERKLYTINTSHTAIAWIGAFYGYKLIREALADERVTSLARQVLEETAVFLIAKHHFEPAKHKQYLETTLDRFSNPFIDDEVSRVGRSPIRKISAGERLMEPMLGAYAQGKNPLGLATAVAAACYYTDERDSESLELQKQISHNGLKQTLSLYTGLQSEHPLLELISKRYEDFRTQS